MQREAREAARVDARRREGGDWEAWAQAWPVVRALATTLADADAEVRRELVRLGLVQPVAA